MPPFTTAFPKRRPTSLPTTPPMTAPTTGPTKGTGTTRPSSRAPEMAPASVPAVPPASTACSSNWLVTTPPPAWAPPNGRSVCTGPAHQGRFDNVAAARVVWDPTELGTLEVALPYEFLSDDWFAEVDKLAAEAAASGGATAPPMKMNILVEGGPDGDKEVHVSEKGFGQGSDDEAKIKLGIAYD